ncbi:MAG: hypothetical protein IPH46_09235 [Bacteroidetes bacterium]|nr:hypothetical protein [Bacteroidota bacterium]
MVLTPVVAVVVLVVRTGNTFLCGSWWRRWASNNIGNCGVNLAGGPGLTTLDGGASGSGMVAGGINGNGGGANFALVAVAVFLHRWYSRF